MDLSRYYEEISKEPLIDRYEEQDLFLEYYDPAISQARRDEIRARIIRSNLRFVFKQAKYFSKNDPDTFEELIGAGNEGLLVGFEKYKPNPDVRYLSYAGHWVSQRILKAMAGMRIVALPIWKQQLSARIHKFIDSKENITFEDLKKEFPDVPEKDLRELFDTKYLTFYIEDMDVNGPEFEIDPIGSEVETNIDKERIHRIIDELPSPHKEIVQMTFGMKDGNERTHNDMAKELSLSKDQLREYKREAMAILKEKLQPTR
ncbi:RNA polymerase sigma factor RpoS [compost metagenome]